MPSQRFKGFTVLKGLEGFKGLEGLERLEGFKGLRAGIRSQRQTWTPIDVWPWGHKKPLMCGPGVPVGCKRAGKRQTGMPIRSH